MDKVFFKQGGSWIEGSKVYKKANDVWVEESDYSSVFNSNSHYTHMIYTATDLVCDGTNYFDTGFAPFSADNLNKDFKITIYVSNLTAVSGGNNQDVILGCKYEGTLGGKQYPGIYFRRHNGDLSRFQIGGATYWTPTIASVLDHTLYIWRQSGNWYAQIENETVQTLSINTTTFDQNIVIGAGIQTNGTPFRYSNCTVDFIKIEYI